jgi:hypothetical protein
MRDVATDSDDMSHKTLDLILFPSPQEPVPLPASISSLPIFVVFLMFFNRFDTWLER